MRVLLIEDEQKTGYSVQSYLKDECGFEVIWLKNGLEGLEMAKKEVF
jgi:DNA-binding response OmpR family regulator